MVLPETKIAEIEPLENCMAIITGNTRGIGGAIAKKLAQAGASVVIHCREKRNRAVKMVQEFQAMGFHQDKFPVVMTDLGIPGAVRKMYAEIKSAKPGWKTNVLFNNVAVGMEERLKDLSPDERQRYIRRVNIDAQIEMIEVGYEMGMIDEGAVLVYVTSNYARNWRPDLDIKQYSDRLGSFLVEYHVNVAAPKYEAEQRLFGGEMESLIRSHNGILVGLSAGIVTGTPAEAGLKIMKVWDEATRKLGYTTLENVASAAFNIVTNPPLSYGQFVIVPDIPTR